MQVTEFSAIGEDIDKLTERYGPELVMEFALDLWKGRIRFSKKDRLSTNLLEKRFLQWVEKRIGTLNETQLKRLIQAGSGPPLQTKSAAILLSHRLSKKEPKHIQNGEEFGMPELSQNDIVEALSDWLAKKR